MMYTILIVLFTVIAVIGGIIAWRYDHGTGEKKSTKQEKKFIKEM